MKKTHPFWNLKNKTKSWKKIEIDSVLEPLGGGQEPHLKPLNKKHELCLNPVNYQSTG